MQIRPILALALCLNGCALLEAPPSPKPETTAATAKPAEAPPPIPVVPASPPPVAVEDKDAALHIKKKILVLPFLDHSERGQETVARNVQEQVQNSLAGQPDIVVIQPADLPDAMLVPELGSYNWKKIFSIAHAEGIAGVLTGTIDTMENTEVGGEHEVGFFHTQQFTTDVKLTIELYDVAGRRRQFARSEVGTVSEERTQLLENNTTDQQEKERQLQAASRAIKKILGMLPNQVSRLAWSGHIAKIEMHRFYINGGRATGLTPGQLLRVFAEGEPVFDTLSGRALGIPQGRMKGMLRIVENFGPDASIAVVHSGAGFREQDRIEPFNPPAPDR